MTKLPVTPETIAIARHVIWFEPAETALRDPVRFMAYAMTYAGAQEIGVLRRYITNADIEEALDQAPPGIIDARSWAYWNAIVGRWPTPAMPTRQIPDRPTGR
jgi:hypothetical protein